MRHEQVHARNSYRKVDLDALESAAAEVIPAATADAGPTPYKPTPAAPDLPAAAGMLIVASYAVLLGAFAVATVASAYSIFMIAICAFFMAAFFTVPWLFLRQQPGGDGNPAFSGFMDKGMDTLTGHIGGGAALVQMMIVPVFLTAGVLLIAISIAVIL